MQVEPKDEEEVDELAMATEEEEGAGSFTSAQDEERLGSNVMIEEDAEGQEAAATLLQASTSLPTLHHQPLSSAYPSSSTGLTAEPSSNEQQEQSSAAGPICANCSTQTTSLWRRSPEGQTLCNACSLYQKMKGTPRPVSLKTDVIKHRNRSKGDRKSAKAAAAAAAAAASASQGASGTSSTATDAIGTPGSSKAKKSSSSTGANGNKTRQSSVAPSTASSAIREEEESEMDEMDEGHSYANTSNAGSIDGSSRHYHHNQHHHDSHMANSSKPPSASNSPSIPSSSSSKIPYPHRLSNGMTEAEYQAKKSRNPLLELSMSLNHTPLTPGQLHAQAAQQAALASRLPSNANTSSSSSGSNSNNPWAMYEGIKPHSSIPDVRSARNRELAAAYALANASGSGGSNAGGLARRAVSVDGRSTPTHPNGHAPPIPWNIASYFNGMAERERQKQAAQAAQAQVAASHSFGSETTSAAASAAGTNTHTANSTRNNSRANTASNPNSAPSSATVSPTTTALPDPPTTVPTSTASTSSSNNTSMYGLTLAQQAQAAQAAAAQAAYRASGIPPYAPHPHSNFLAAYRARQIAAQQSAEEYTARQKAVAEREEKEKAQQKDGKSTSGASAAASGQGWPALATSRSDPKLHNGASGGSSNAGMSENARIAQGMGWRPPSKDAQRSSSRHASPSVPGTYPRSASASREGSRHNTPPAGASNSHSQHNTNYIQSHPTGPTRLLFGLPTLYPRSASSDKYGPGGGGRNGSSGPGGLRNFDNMTEEDRERQKARLDQLFAAAGQRLSAAQQAQGGKAATSGTPSASSSKAESMPPSAHSTPHLKDLVAASADSAAGRSPATVHHAAYRPYDLSHRSSSRAATGGHSSAPNSTVLGPRTSPNHLNTSLSLGPNAVKSERRPGSPGSQSSSSEHDASSYGRKRASLPRITSPLLDPTLSPPFSGIPYPGKGIIEQVVPFLDQRRDSMAIDEVDEDELALEGQEGLDGLTGLKKTASARAGPTRDAASNSPPFGVTLGPSASERRGRSTTRKARDAMGEDDYSAHHAGDHVAHELGAMRVRDASRSSSQIRTNSRSPDRMNAHHIKNYGHGGFPPDEKFPELPRFSHISQMVHAHVNNMPHPSSAGFPRSSIPTADMDDGIVKNALTHRPVSDLRAFGSPHPTLPSLSEALSSSASSRSISASRTGSSRHSSAARTALSHRSMMDDGGAILPPPANLALDEVARLRTRIQELEFINGLMESRVAELEGVLVGNPEKAGTMIMAPHGPNCSCRCSEIDSESLKAAEHLKKELLTHGVGGIGEQASRDLLDLLAHRLGYKPGAGTPIETRPPSANGTQTAA